MAITGFTAGKYWEQKVGQSYTGYLDSTKKNRLFKDALISLVEQKYLRENTTKVYDEITFVTKTNVIFGVNNNQLHIAPIQISNIVVGGTTGTFTTFLPHNLVTGQVITISDVLATIFVPNGNYTVSVVDANRFQATVIGSSGVYTANTGTFTYATMIPDYWHILAIKALFSQRIYDITITGASNTSPISITLASYNKLRTGDKITISGVLGNTNANGTFYIKKTNNFKVALYSDINLQNPVVGNGAYTSGGIISEVVYRYCTPYISSAKIGFLNIPNITMPSYEIADDYLKIYPQEQICSEVTIDYIKTPDKVIDVTDNVTDLTLYYPEKFIYAIINQAAILFAQEVRDTELFQESSQEAIKSA